MPPTWRSIRWSPEELPSSSGTDSLLGIERLGDTVEPLADLTAPLDIQRGGESSSLDFEPMSLDGIQETSLNSFATDQASPLDFSVDAPKSPLDFPDDLDRVPAGQRYGIHHAARCIRLR